MVDPTKGLGPVQGFSTTRAPSTDVAKKTSEASASESAREDIKVSDEAITEEQVEQSLAAARDALRSSSFSLGLNPGFITDSLA